MPEFPFKPLRLRNLEQQLEQAFDELVYGQGRSGPPTGPWQPAIDLYELPDCYLVEADVPGVAPEDLRVEVEEHGLTISGRRQSSSVERSAHGICIERRKGSFLRHFVLEHAIVPERVERQHQEGTLILRLPKRTSKS